MIDSQEVSGRVFLESRRTFGAETEYSLFHGNTECRAIQVVTERGLATAQYKDGDKEAVAPSVDYSKLLS